LSRLEVKPLFIEPGSPLENGYVESFNGKMRDELLAREIFYSLKEAQILIEIWRKESTTPSDPIAPWAIDHLRLRRLCSNLPNSSGWD